MLAKDELARRYEEEKLSVSAIAKLLRCSEGKVNYWLARHGISKRSIRDAIYQKWNPNGDPFVFSQPDTIEAAMLFGVGMGLYWGEGTKSNKESVRLGNSDPLLIRVFVKFLTEIYHIDASRLRFGLQIFGDMDEGQALRFWQKELGISRRQILPTVVVTPHRGVGNYRKKTRYGVLTVYFNNRKLRDILCDNIEAISMGKAQ